MSRRICWILTFLLAGISAPSLANTHHLEFVAQAPLLDAGVMTQMNMATFFAGGTNPTGNLVTISVTNTGDAVDSFRILFRLKAIPADPDLRQSCRDLFEEEGGQGCWVQRKILVNQVVKPGQTWTRTSAMLESETFQSKGLDAEVSPFQRLVAREGRIPPGSLWLDVSILQPNTTGSHENLNMAPAQSLPFSTIASRQSYTFRTNFQPTQPAMLLAPGQPSSQGSARIQTTTPDFVFAGNLDGYDLGGESPYRISIWEVRSGESIGETMDRRPVRTAKIERSPVGWRSEWAPLENGKRYVWRVDALLRGLTSDWLPSEPFAFATPEAVGIDGNRTGSTLGVSIAPTTDAPHPTPEQLEIIEKLSLVIGPYRPLLEELVRTSLPDPSALRIGGSAATRSDFLNLIQDILDGRASVAGAEIRR